jgi:Acetyltransferase (GNAT) domain
MDPQFHFTTLDFTTCREEFIQAWQAAFAREIDPRLFDWIFGPAAGNRIHLARDAENGRIAAGYCLLRQDAVLNGTPSTVLLCNNVFSAPDYRTHNLFVKLGRHALAESADKGDLALGFPNALSLPGHRRVGWTVCPSMVFHEREPAPAAGAIEARFRALTPADGAQVENLWRSRAVDPCFFIVKTASYFRWRYFDRPLFGRRYFIEGLFEGPDLVGYVVLSHFQANNRLHIVDIQARSECELVDCLHHAAARAAELAASLVNVWANPALGPALGRAGFRPGAEETSMIVKVTNPALRLDLATAVSHHHLVLGDNDVL